MDRGERAIRFIENLRHSKGKWAGKPFILEVWQKDFVRALFGTLRSDGLRQYRSALLFIPRKNGKSQLAAAIALFCLFADGEKGAEIYSAAAEREQASLVFNEAASMIRQDRTLSNLCRIIDSQKKIIYPANNSFYKAISADAHTKHGFNASVVIYDELHCAPNRDLWDVLQTSTASRTQPLMLAITTAGFDKNSICREVYDYALKVRDGLINDPTFLPVIYEAAPTDDWKAESTWKKANPNYGISVQCDYLKKEAAKAAQIPTYLNTFLRLHLNLWTQSDVRWLMPDQWERCGSSIDLGELAGLECWGGLDLASTTDVAALALVFHVEDRWAVIPRFWIPKEKAHEREHRDRVPYLTWAREGFVTLTEGNVVDYDRIRADINALRAFYNIKEIAVDRWNSTQLTNQLVGDGAVMVPFGQGFGSMSSPTKELEKLVVSQKLVHPNNPCLNWMASNCVAEIDAAANVKLSRSRSTEKIDGMVALVMALGRAMARGAEPALYAGPLVV